MSAEGLLEPCFFLQDDLDALDVEIERVREQIRVAKAAGQEGTEQSSESWHDNYIFEEAQRQLKMFLNHLGGLSRARERAELVMPPPAPSQVEIGTTVTFRIEEDRHVDTFSIGSYMVFDRLRDLDFISYETPIARILLGASVGETRSGEVGGRTKSLTVIALASASEILRT